MANWTAIPDSNIDAGSPLRDVDLMALRDNTQFVKDTHGYQVFTASGTFTPPAGITSYRVIIVGGGGGGGRGAVYTGSGYSVGGSGGNGGAIETIVSGQSQASYNIIVGTGGAGGTTSGDGGAGSNSSAFGMTVGGGAGGSNATTFVAGTNGAAGSTPAAMIRGNASTPRLSFGYGTGGAGGSGNNGAAGKSGVVIIEW